MVEYPQTVGNLTESSQNLFDLIKGRNLSCYPDEQIRLAISRAVAFEGPRGWRIGKDKQTHRIDIVVALGMASLAAVKRDAGPTIYPLATWLAAFGDGTNAPFFDQDGSRDWRDRRCPPQMPLDATTGDRAAVDAAWRQMVDDTCNAWRGK
jgi:hypothetical protein